MTRTLLISAVIVSILGRYSYIIAESDQQYANLFYLSNAVGWLLAILSIRAASTGITKIIAEGAAILAFGEILDELIFVATELHLNEVYTLAFVAIWTIYRIIKRKKK